MGCYRLLLLRTVAGCCVFGLVGGLGCVLVVQVVTSSNARLDLVVAAF